MWRWIALVGLLVAGATVGAITTTSHVGASLYQPAPEVVGVSPTSGPASGGTLVTVTGSNLTGASAVYFGSNAASQVSVQSDTTLTAVSPPSPGSSTVDVTVVTSGGTSATGAADQFTYSTFPGSVVPYPVQSVVGIHLRSPVALVTLTGSDASLQASDVSATVHWPGGASTPGLLQPAVSAVGVETFSVSTSMVFSTAVSATTYTVQVSTSNGDMTSATAPIVVLPKDPQAGFISNPPQAVQDGISLFMPIRAAPDQTSVVAYTWRFLDTGTNDIVRDDPGTRPLYTRVLDNLDRDPGNSVTRELAISLGILPNDANGGLFGAGGLSADQVKQVADVWKAYFPSHIVPHLFDYYGNVGIQETLTDQAGRHSDYTVNVSVQRDCLPWGGPLNGLFGGTTVCDTYNGFAAQFGPHRFPPDWVAFNVSKNFGSVQLDQAKLGFGGGVSLVLTHGLLNSPSTNDVFLGVQFSAQVGTTPNFTATTGWVGSPDPKDKPPDSAINDFVTGFTVSGGGGASIGVNGIGIGLGFNAIYSPRGDDNFHAGEELYAGVAGLGAGAGLIFACSTTLTSLTSGDLSVLKGVFASFSQGTPSNGTLDEDARQIAGILAAVGAQAVGIVERAISNCNPVPT